MCYEKPGDFCHRHLVADWLNAYYKSEREKNEKRIPWNKVKDHLIGLGYKIENDTDLLSAMNEEQHKANEREIEEKVKEWMK